MWLVTGIALCISLLFISITVYLEGDSSGH